MIYESLIDCLIILVAIGIIVAYFAIIPRVGSDIKIVLEYCKDYDQWRVSPVPGYASKLAQEVLRYNLKVMQFSALFLASVKHW